MKKIILIFFMLASTNVASNAQFFVEGVLGAQFSRGLHWHDHVSIKDVPLSHSLTVSPSFGYRLNENVAFGIKGSIISRTDNNVTLSNNGAEILIEKNTFGWGIAVFNRYKLLGIKKFSFLVESSLFIREDKIKETTGTASSMNRVISEIGIHAFPLIFYDISDRFSFMVASDFLSLKLCTFTRKDNETGLKIQTNNFDFNAQSAIFDDLLNLRVGIVYYFNKKTDK